MDSSNVTLMVQEELLVPIAQMSRYTCSSASSNLLFTMDSKGFFTMDFLQNSPVIILEELIILMFNLMREFVTLVLRKV